MLSFCHLRFSPKKKIVASPAPWQWHPLPHLGGVMDFFLRETYRKHTENPNVSSIENGWKWMFKWLVLVNVPWCSMMFHDVPWCSMFYRPFWEEGAPTEYSTQCPMAAEDVSNLSNPSSFKLMALGAFRRHRRAQKTGRDWEPGSTWEPGPRMMWSFSSQMVFSLACENMEHGWTMMNMASGGLQTASEISCLIVIKSG